MASPSAREHAAGGHGHADDNGLSLLTNGHHHDIVQYELDAPTQAALDGSEDDARGRPAVRDRRRCRGRGLPARGTVSPGLGAHYVKYGPRELNPDGVIDGDDPNYPLAILYDGRIRLERLGVHVLLDERDRAGGVRGAERHVALPREHVPEDRRERRIDAPFGPDNASTNAQCAAVGGNMLTFAVDGARVVGARLGQHRGRHLRRSQP